MIMARAKVIFDRDPTLVVGSLRVAFVGPVSAEVPLAKQSTLNESIGSKFCSYKVGNFYFLHLHYFPKICLISCCVTSDFRVHC